MWLLSGMLHLYLLTLNPLMWCVLMFMWLALGTPGSSAVFCGVFIGIIALFPFLVIPMFVVLGLMGISRILSYA